MSLKNGVDDHAPRALENVHLFACPSPQGHVHHPVCLSNRHEVHKDAILIHLVFLCIILSASTGNLMIL